MPNSDENLALDHLTVVAKTLEAGVEHVRQHLGITVPIGGKHPRMGTHNCLMKLGEKEFLEIIAVDPEAAQPGRPRWFGLDGNLSADACLATWVLGTPHIERSLRASIPDVGEATEITRGDLSWLISIAADGSLPKNGAYPSFIQWPEGPHPSTCMPDMGCSLTSLTIQHPQADQIRASLRARYFDERIRFERTETFKMSAQIATPTGTRLLI